MKIAINGAGIAGTTLAYWLLRSGHEVLLLEEAPRLRTGGYIIDFWGIGYDVAEKMGLIPRLRELGYQVREVRLVDERGRRAGGFPAAVFDRMTHGRFTSLRRSDVAATIYDAIRTRVETRFGDSITGVEDLGDRVRVRFEHAPTRDFDLVVGADGLHSRIRGLVFGPEDRFELRLGYQVAAFEVEGYRPRDELVYVGHGIPGRQVSRFSMRDDRTLFLFVFRDEYGGGTIPASEAERKAVLRRAFAGMGWEFPRILEAMENVREIYFDRVSQIRLDRWTTKRTALLGDAAACVSLLAGEGTGLAMAEAYVLAGELQRCGGDHEPAFGNYENLLRPFLEEKQRAAAKFASAFAPRTAFGLRVRSAVTRLMRIPFLADFFIGREMRDDMRLPEYAFPPVPGPVEGGS